MLIWIKIKQIQIVILTMNLNTKNQLIKTP